MKRTTTAVLCLLTIALAATSATAQTLPPAMSGTPPTESFIGEGFCFDAEMSNPGGDPGYGPYLRLIVPTGLTFDSASVFGLDLAGLGLITDAGVFPPAPGNQLTDPLTGTLVTGPEGSRLYTLMAPVGSVVFGQPDTVFSICMSIGLPPDAVVGTPLDVTLQPVYLFGDTPTGDNGPIEGTASTDPVTPTLILFEKNATGGKNAAGPSDTAGYTLTADVANQQTVTDLVFSDTLPASFIYTGHSISGSGVGCTTTTAPAVGANGGLLEVSCASVLGTTGAGEIVVDIAGYADDILDHENCDFQPLPNSATLDARYLGLGLPQASDTAEFVTQHLVIEKSAPAGGAPGSPLTYTIDFRVSDYIDADNLVLVDTLPDGIDFTTAGPFTLIYEGSSYPIAPVVQQDTPSVGRTTVTWDLSAAIGAILAGGTSGSLSYPATVQTLYDATGIEVLANDGLPNTVNGAFDLVGALNPACFDNSSATVTILPVNISKTIVNPAPAYRPGDTVIFSLTMSIPSGDSADIVFTDYLPLPVFDVTTIDPTWGGPNVYPGPATSPESAAILGATPPLVTPNPAENSVRIEFPDILTGGLPQTLEVRLAVQVTDLPFSDPLFLTNLFAAESANTPQQTSTDLQPVFLQVRAPELVITKGVFATTNGGATITPAPPANLLDDPVEGDLTNGDAGDVVTFVATVENQGGAPAGNVRIWDSVPAGHTGCSVVSVVNGNGTPLTFTGDFFDAGNPLLLDTDLIANDEDPSTYGADTAIVTFACTLDTVVEPRQVITDTASALWTTAVGTPGVDDYPRIDDDASVTIADTTILKSVLPTNAVVGQVVTYTVTVTVPGGTSSPVTLTDDLTGRVAFVDCLSVSASPGMSTTIGSFADACNDPTNPTVTGNGRYLNFDLGTVTNPGSPNADAGTVTFTYTAVVLNTSSVNHGNQPRNRATWSWSGGSVESRVRVTVQEPQLRVVKETVPEPLPPVDAGDTVSFRITVDHTNPLVVPAFDVALSDVLPAELSYVAATLDCTGGTLVPDSCGFAGDTLTASWALFPTTGQTVITFDAIIDIAAAPGTIATNTASMLWSSLPGAVSGPLSPYNSNSCERTGVEAPLLPYCGSGNDYNALDPATVTIASVGLAKGIVATSEPSTGDGQYRAGIDDLTVGETATFHITATIPEGTTPLVVITDTLPYTNGVMEVVSASLVSIGGNLLPTNVPPITDISDAQLADGLVDTVSFDFGQVINIPDGAVTLDDELVVAVVGRLVDIPANLNGDELTNDASVQFGPGLDSTASADVDVVEPLLQITKTGNATTGDAGDIVTYTVTVDHVPPTPASTANAFDLVITDAIPAGMTYVAASLTDTGAVPADSLGEAAGVITAVWNEFPLGSIGEFTFQASIDPGAQPGANLNNTANGQWDTLPADGDPNERTHTASDSHNVLITSPGMTKTVFATSEPSTGNGINGPEPDLTIGEEVTYRFVATFQEGVTPTTLVEDQLPTGTAILSHVSSRVVSVGGNLSGPSLPTAGTAGVPSDSNTDTYDDLVVWFLGDVTNVPDGVEDDNDRIEFEVVAMVVDEPLNQGGLDDLSNTATVGYTGGSASAVADVDFVEPELRITKSVTDPADGFVDADDVVTIELLIEHFGSTADAFSVEITDVFPDPGLSWINDGTVTTTCPGGVVVDSTGDPTIEFAIGTLSIADASCVVSYQARVDAIVQPGVTYTNLATAQWDSTPAFVAGETRRQTTTDTASVTVLAPSLVKIAQSTSLADTGMTFYHPADFDLAIGETVTYQLTVIFPEGRTDTAVVTDTLPADAVGVIEAVGASVSSLGASLSTTLPGTPQFFDNNLGDGLDDTVVFDFGTVLNSPDGVSNDDDRLVLLVVGRVVDVTDNTDGDWLTNTGTFTFATGGPLTDTALIDVVEPDMVVTKNMGPVVNGLVTLSVQIANNGTAPAYDIILEDVLNDSLWNTATISPLVVPAGYTFSTAAGPGAGDTTITMASDAGSSPPDNSVEPGEIIAFQFQVALADPLNPPATVPNTATNTQTTSLPGSDPDERELPPTSGSDVLDLPILDATKSATLIADNDGSGTVSPGDIIRYTISVTNTGAGAATLVVVTDTPDPNGIFLAGTVVAQPGGTVLTGNTGGDTTVEAAFPAIAANSTATVTYDVAIPAPLANGIDQLVNQAVIDSEQTPPFSSDDPTTGPDDDPTVVPIDAAPDIAVAKTDGATSTIPGATLTYTVTVQNLGNQNAVNVVLTDAVPAGTSFVSASDGGVEVPPGSGSVVWPAFDLPAGATVVRTLVVDVLNPPPAGLATIVNTATAADDGTNGPDPNPGNNTGIDTNDLIYADLAVTKTDNPDPVVAGETLTWTLTVTNNGVSAATNVVLDDTIPAGVTINSISAPCAAGFPCTIGSLAAGASATVTIDVTVAADTTGTLSNSATVAADEVDPDPTNNTDTEPTTVGQSTDLEVVKSDNTDPAVAGEGLVWTLMVTNNGPSDATGVVLDDTIPAGVTVNSISAPCAAGFPCTIGDLAAGASATVTVDVAVDADLTGVLDNTATVTGNEPDPDPSNDTDTEPTDIIPVADLVVTKTGPGSVASGTDLVFSIEVENLGPSDATALLITDPTPPGLSFVSATAPCAAGFPCSVPALAAGSSFSFDVTYAVPAGYTEPDPILNTASVSSEVQDPDPTNNTSSSSTAVDRTPVADLQIVKTGPPSAAVGSTVTYQLEISNLGPDDAADVVIDDPTPAGLGFVSASAPCAAGFPCTLGTLNSGAAITVEVTFSIPPGYTTPDPIANTATVTSSTDDPDPSNNTDTDTTPLGADTADLALTKIGPSQALPGDDVSYTITVVNNGPATATGVVLDDLTPAGLSFVSATAPCAAGFPCALGDIVPDGTVLVSVTFNIPAGYGGPDPVVNTAAVTGNEPDPDPSNNTDTTSTGLAGDAADVGVVKTGPAAAPQGTDVTFEITVTNNGPGAATAVTLDDPTPAGLIWVSASDPCAAGFPCSLGDIAAGSAITVQATFSIPADYLAPDPIVNTATVSTTSPDPNPGNDSSSHPVTLAPVVDLAVVKTDSPDPVVAGTALTWTVTVSNNGPSDATGVVLDDTLPPEVTLVSISAPCAAGFPCTIGDLAAGASVDVVVDVTVNPDATGTITNTATVTGNETDIDPSNNTDTEPTGVNPEADLAVVKTASPEPVVAGDTVTWTITVTNNGPSDATGVVVDDTFPPEVTVTLISAPCAAGFPCTIGDLAVGASVVITIDATVDVATQGSITNTATVSGNEPDPDPGNDTSTVVTTVDYVEIGITKSVNDPPSGAWQLGDVVTWTMEVVNTGTIEATGIVLTDDIPDLTAYYPESIVLDGLSLSDADDGDAGRFDVVNNRIVVDLDPIPAGGSRIVTFAVAISSQLPNGSHIIENTAAVTSPAGSVTSDTVVVPVIVTGIPTVSDLGLAVLIMLIGLAGMMVLRRRVY